VWCIGYTHCTSSVDTNLFSVVHGYTYCTSSVETNLISVRHGLYVLYLIRRHESHQCSACAIRTVPHPSRRISSVWCMGYAYCTSSVDTHPISVMHGLYALYLIRQDESHQCSAWAIRTVPHPSRRISEVWCMGYTYELHLSRRIQ
jgi:hypothetical protein